VFTDEIYFKSISEHVTMQTAISEVWELGAFLINTTLGPIHSMDVNAVGLTIQSWAEDGVISQKLNLQKTRGALKSLIDAIKILEKAIKKRKPATKPRSKFKKTQEKSRGGGMRRAVSAGSLGQLEVSDQHQPNDPFGFEKNQDTPSAVIIDATRDQVRDKLRNFISSVKSMLKRKSEDPESRDVLDRLTFLASMENGFFWDDAYASDMLDDVCKNSNYKDVLKKLYGLLCMHPDDVEPKSKEVVRRLTFFTNSLFMDMPDAPSIHDMFSWNVLTPYPPRLLRIAREISRVVRTLSEFQPCFIFKLFSEMSGLTTWNDRESKMKKSYGQRSMLKKPGAGLVFDLRH
jgi:callose synthase